MPSGNSRGQACNLSPSRASSHERSSPHLFELNGRCFCRAAVAQLHLHGEKTGDRTDRGGRVPVENELRTAETESTVPFRTCRRRVKQNAGRSRRRGRATARAWDDRRDGTQTADDVSAGIEKLPF